VIELNPDTVRSIIQRLREFQAYAGPDADRDDEAEPEADDLEEVLGETPEAPGEDQLVAVVDDLEPDQQITLVALVWLGRGDYSLEEWDEALAEARSAYNDRAGTYLAAMPLAADYLEEGLSLHGYDED
jgi:hypothetical protein